MNHFPARPAPVRARPAACGGRFRVEGESALIAAIAETKRQGATVILVSHRFAMMRVVDMICVLQGGVMEKFGPRDQMLQELQAVPQAPTRKVAAMSDAMSGGGA